VIGAGRCEDKVRAGDASRSHRLPSLVALVDGQRIADPDLFPRAFASLERQGRLITAGAHGGGTVSLDVKSLYLNSLTVLGSTVLGSTGRVTPDDLTETLGAAAQGRHRVLIDRVLPLADAALAHRIVAERSGSGKVVLRP
jgi:NADPH:quinone reductase